MRRWWCTDGFQEDFPTLRITDGTHTMLTLSDMGDTGDLHVTGGAAALRPYEEPLLQLYRLQRPYGEPLLQLWAAASLWRTSAAAVG